MTSKRRTKNIGFTGHKKAKGPRPQKRTPDRSGAKVRAFSEVLRLAKAAKARGETVVTTNGCFDILHVGHVRYLAEAKKHGDILIVGVNSDASVRALKGPARPINTALERAELIASLRPVDAVFIFREATPHTWLAQIKPHVHVKGGDRKLHEIVEKDIIEQHGGRIVLAKVVNGRSTTNTLKKVRGD